jgi:hypothetical protein
MSSGTNFSNNNVLVIMLKKQNKKKTSLEDYKRSIFCYKYFVTILPYLSRQTLCFVFYHSSLPELEDLQTIVILIRTSSC